MKILITNDDGIYAAGMPSLVRWAQTIGEVTVAAPEVEQSGKSHAIELHKGFRITKVDLFPDVAAYAVDSTPADCVRFAVFGLQEKFDLVISGINRGYNIGRDIMYSGTVAAAYEAANLSIPAIAVSTEPSYYENAVQQLPRVYDFFVKHRLLEINDVYNVNIPPLACSIRITRQGGPYFSDDFVPQNPDFYRPVGKCVHVNKGELTIDTDAVISGHISVTPLQLDRTSLTLYEKLMPLSET